MSLKFRTGTTILVEVDPYLFGGHAAIATAVTVSEILKNNGLAYEKSKSSFGADGVMMRRGGF